MQLDNNSLTTTAHGIATTKVIRGAPIMLWPIIGRLPIVYFRTHLRSIKVISSLLCSVEC